MRSRNNVLERINREIDEHNYTSWSMYNWDSPFQEKYAKQLATIGKIILILQVVCTIYLVAAFCLSGFPAKYVLAGMALLPLPAYIFTLLFPEVSQWIIRDKRNPSDFMETEEWKKTHVNLGSPLYLFFFVHVLIFESYFFGATVQVNKGFLQLSFLCLATVVIFDLAGCLRIGFKRVRRKQRLLFLFMNTFGVCFGTVAMCFLLSTPAVHEPCSFVSKRYSSGYRSATILDVTVELSDGTTYTSRVPSGLYYEAEQAELVACRKQGPFGIEFLRVHRK